MLCDAQTSGGLLVAIPARRAATFERDAPAARRIWAVRPPTRPSPRTTAHSPIWIPDRRTPCNAIDPRVANAASSSGTPSGTGTVSWRGTLIHSACDACPAPAQATAVPGARSSTPGPADCTQPLAA